MFPCTTCRLQDVAPCNIGCFSRCSFDKPRHYQTVWVGMGVHNRPKQLSTWKMEPFAQKHVFMNAEPCASIFPCVWQSRKEKQSVARTKTCRQIRALRRSANSNTCVAMQTFLSSKFMFCYVNHLKLQVSKHDRAQLIKDGMAEPCACWHTQRNLSLSGTNKAVVTCWD